FLDESVALRSREQEAEHARARHLEKLAADAQQQTKAAISRRLVLEAERTRSVEPRHSLLLNLAAYRIAPTTEARNGLVSPAAHQYYAGEFLGHQVRITALTVSPDGRTAASGDVHGVICIWDLSRRTLINRFAAHSDRILGLRFSPDGQLMASCGDDR